MPLSAASCARVSHRTATRVCEGSLGEGDTGALSVQYLRNDALYTSEYVLEGIAEEPGEGEPEGEAKEGSADAWSGVDFQRSRPWTPYLQDAKPELLMLNLGEWPLHSSLEW